MANPKDTALRARRAAQRWLGIASDTFLKSCESVPQGQYKDILPKLRVERDEFLKQLAKYDEAQTAVECHLDDDGEQDSDILAVHEFKKRSVFPTQMKIEEVFRPCASSDSNKSSNKLPKYTLPSFEGDSREWQPFWDNFQVMVEADTSIPTIQKFSYLRGALKGEAKATIDGLSLTVDNYETAKKLLLSRYGGKEKIIFNHIQDLLALSVTSKPTVKQLWNFHDKLQIHIRSLASLGIGGETYGVILTPVVLSRLPTDLRLEWARSGESHESDLKHLMEFLENEVRRRERSQVFVPEEPEPISVATGSALASSSSHSSHSSSLSSSSRPGCAWCQGPHPIFRCPALVELSKAKRKSTLMLAGYCIKCFHKPSKDSPHSFKACKVRCRKCNGNHDMFFCDTQNNKKNTDQEKTATTLASSSSTSPSSVPSAVLLQTLQIFVEGENGKVKVNALFDTGADRTYISDSVVQKIKPRWVETRPLAFAAFGADQLSPAKDRHVYALTLTGGSGRVQVEATGIENICVPVRQHSIPSHLKDLPNVVTVPAGKSLKIDLLIGLDYYWRVMKGKITHLTADLVIQKSILGDVVSGSVPLEQGRGDQTSHQLFCCDQNNQSFWDLESIGILSNEQLDTNKSVDPVTVQFEQSIKLQDKRYTVTLPWKEGAREMIIPNKASAEKRLESLKNRFLRDPELGRKYHRVIADMLTEGIIEEVEDATPPSGPEFYLPHHPVVKEQSLSTKVRPVFDASAKAPNGVSLNDCMETGPNLLPDLVGVLMRFRRWQIALTADVQKAFLQVGVDPHDRDAHRFLWDDNGTTRVMRFARVPFGNRGSPFLLMATIRYHLIHTEPSEVTHELLENLYMDDWLSGCDEEKRAFQMFAEAQNIMLEAGMKLAKWASNNKDLSNHFQSELATAVAHKVLGLRWCMNTDMFTFLGFPVKTDTCLTKRLVLSLISRLFDPMGFLTPFVIRAKILFQTIWQQGLQWDQLLPKDLHEQFRKWLIDLSVLQQWSIRRCFFSIHWSQKPKLAVHGFGDASEHAYGACVYLVAEGETGESESALVISKARVAPLKKITLPRLELLGALLCARLVSYVKSELRLDQNVQTNCWTDSMVVLSWIKNDPTKWKTFVCNRVTEIQGLVEPSLWKHCPGKSNPADLVTRGVSAEDLIHSQLWSQGPTDVMTQAEGENTCDIPSNSILMSVDLACQTEEKMTQVSEPVIDIERHSTLTKAIRVMAYALRFIHNCRNRGDKHEGELTFSEISAAKLQLLKENQKVYSEEISSLKETGKVSKSSPLFKLTPFLCSDGLLRVRGRLQFAGLSEDSRHPVIVPKGHLGLLLARHIHVTMRHAGVNSMMVQLRNNYWVVGARRICRKVKRNCVRCQRFDSPTMDQPNAPLPEERVTQAPPFAVSGLDHGGPLLCGDFPGSKFYILLFTCAVIRGVHLELVNSLSCDETVLALRRFFARRGTPSILWSDNAKGFWAAKSKLLETMGSEGPEWRLIPPRSPWWGGFYERLIGSVKAALKKTLGRQSLCRQELLTLLQEVEACVNSRPLTCVGDGLDSCRALTPNHFLIGRTAHKEKIDLPSIPSPLDAQQLSKLFEGHSDMLASFWFSWSEDYLKNLPPFRGQASETEIKVGTVVLIEDEGPRIGWPLGVIETVYPGKDGLVRKVDVKTARGTFSRSVQRLRKLEIPIYPSSDEPTLQQAHSESDKVDVNDAACEVKESALKMKSVRKTIDNTGAGGILSDHIALKDSTDNSNDNPVVHTRVGRRVQKPNILDL